MRYLVTGASGYIGKHLIIRALEKDINITAASRKPLKVNGIAWIPYDIRRDNNCFPHDKFDAVIHLAASTTFSETISISTELKSASELISFAAQKNAKFLFLSSQTADANAPTAYGRTKYLIERMVLSSGGYVVRAGQVYGGICDGLYGSLSGIVKYFPVLPAFFPPPKIQPIHVNDLIEGIFNILTKNDLKSKLICLGSENPIPFHYFLAAIAKYRLRCYRLFIPVPTFLVSLFSFIAGSKQGNFKGLTRLRSLFSLTEMETKVHLRHLDLSLRTLESGMTPSGNDRRRKLLLEGNAFLSYILKFKPQGWILRRYVRAVESLRDGLPLNLQDFFLKFPITIALIDRSPNIKESHLGNELSWRLNATVLIAEATKSSASRFIELNKNRNGFFCFIFLIQTLMVDTLWRIPQILAKPFIFKRIPSGK